MMFCVLRSIPRFFGPDYLGGSRDGGERSLPSSGVR